MVIILQIETSTQNCSVALSKNGKTISVIENKTNFSHAEDLASFVDDILKLNHLSASQLTAIAVGKGPGSYTGLRIGVSLAKGLAFGLNIPLISVSSLQNMLYNPTVTAIINNANNSFFVPVIDARRMEVYSMVFNQNYELIKPEKAIIVSQKTFDYFDQSPVYIFGDAANKLKPVLENQHNITIVNDVIPSANAMTAIAYKKFNNNNFENIAYFEPFYLKDFIAGKPKKLIWFSV